MAIRSAKASLTVTRTKGTIQPVTLKPPGGIFTWKRVRVSNYSPYQVTLNYTTPNENTPPHVLAPYQQDIYQYTGRTGGVACTFTYNTALGTTSYILAEFGTETTSFQGVYPSLIGNVVTTFAPPTQLATTAFSRRVTMTGSPVGLLAATEHFTKLISGFLLLGTVVNAFTHRLCIGFLPDVVTTNFGAIGAQNGYVKFPIRLVSTCRVLGTSGDFINVLAV